MDKYLRQAAEMALKALVNACDALGNGDYLGCRWILYGQVTALRQALAEPDKLAQASEREAIMDEWWMCVQSDLENGVKSLNEQAAEKWKKEYPAIAGFAAKINARGE